MSAGKGSTPRKVDCGKYAVNYEKIFNKTEVHICRKDEPVEITAKESEQPIETEYRFLKAGELIQEGDQFYAQSIDQWLFTNIGHMSLHNTEACKYRRKDERIQECSCGRIKINHYTLGWICEDCEWHGEPY